MKHTFVFHKIPAVFVYHKIQTARDCLCSIIATSSQMLISRSQLTFVTRIICNNQLCNLVLFPSQLVRTKNLSTAMRNFCFLRLTVSSNLKED